MNAENRPTPCRAELPGPSSTRGHPQDAVELDLGLDVLQAFTAEALQSIAITQALNGLLWAEFARRP